MLGTLLDYKDKVWDEELGIEYWRRAKPYITAMTEWTNAMTGDLPEHIIGTLVKGGSDQHIANQVAEWFENPLKAHEAFFLDSSLHTQS
ncbi:hypothetical protein [Paenibacillus sp. Marseille-Q4541]|uniref:hypothetical protein n=1 Tax=Paenibacillus sp. Marseille-Q4541 TaxID=2831522 RepID=UPI001BA886AF|nr:hypothetical protein [Paenibacillus sp. Marseille-Q4541]